MEVTGEIIKILEPKTGTSSHGNWKKQEIVIETEVKYNNKICLVNWNDKLDISSLKVNDTIRCIFDASSKEYKNNWYTELRMTKIEVFEKVQLEGFDEESHHENKFLPKRNLSEKVQKLLSERGKLKRFGPLKANSNKIEDQPEENITDQSSQSTKENPVSNSLIAKSGIDPAKRLNISKEELEDFIDATPETEELKQDAPINIDDAENSDTNEKLRYMDFVEKILKAGDQLSQVMRANKDDLLKKIIEVREVEEILDDIFDKKNPLENHLINYFNKVTRKPGKEEYFYNSWICLSQTGIGVLLSKINKKITFSAENYAKLMQVFFNHILEIEPEITHIRREDPGFAATCFISFVQSGKAFVFPELLQTILFQVVDKIKNENDKYGLYTINSMILKEIMMKLIDMIQKEEKLEE